MLELAEKIKELLKEDLPKNVIKEYYVGTPAQTDKIIMPCIVVDIRGGSNTLSMTGFDESEFTGYVQVYFDKKSGMMNQASKGSPAIATRADDIVFGLDLTGTYAKYKEGTVMHTLRHHLFLSGSTINTQNSEVVYNMDITSWERVDEPTDGELIYQINFTGRIKIEVITRS